jgi:cell division protein FtsI/penicillin-binding protein 2
MSRLPRFRLLLAGAFITACFLGLSWRLFSIQILSHEKHLASARSMRRSLDPILAYRGDIHLSDGVILARDVVDHEVGIDPRSLPAEKIPEVTRLVSDATGKPAEHRRERLFLSLRRKESGGAYVPLAAAVSESVVEEIRGAARRVLSPLEMKGLVVHPKARRTYPRGTLAASVVGVTDAGGEGVEGIEKSLDACLSRCNGHRELVRDAAQKTRIYRLGSLEVPAVDGYDVHLTISSRIQAIAEEELEAGVAREKAEAGLIIVMDARSGDILAMASRPTYEPGRFAEYPDPERLKRRANRAVENLYEPGSVIKVFLAAHALDRGVLRREDFIRSLMRADVTWDGGRMARFGRRTVSDVHEHPDMTFEDVVVHSSNIGMALLGLRLGQPGISEVFEQFGLCRPTGIALPAEARGKYTRKEEWRPLYSSVSMAFGYEVMVSPIQLARGFAAVVNGGYLLEPRIVDRIARDGDVQVFPSRKVVGRPISEETSRQMREILRLVVEEGTARYLRIEGFEFGGKTGTADMGRGGYTKSDYLASFEAFAPFEDPQVVALCMIEKPRGASYYGSMVAGPIVVEVFRRMFGVTQETRLARIRKAARG